MWKYENYGSKHCKRSKNILIHAGRLNSRYPSLFAC